MSIRPSSPLQPTVERLKAERRLFRLETTRQLHRASLNPLS